MKFIDFLLKTKSNIKTANLNILIAGEGGQGAQTIGEILARAAAMGELRSSYMPHFGVEQRGGVSLAFVRINSEKIDYPKFKTADIIVLMTKRAIPRLGQYVGEKTKIINLIGKDYRPFNMVVMGILTNAIQKLGLNLSSESVETAIDQNLGKKKGLGENLAGFKKGLSEEVIAFGKNLPGFSSRPEGKWKILIDKFTSKEKKKITFIRFPELCKGCGLCIECCPNKALIWGNDGKGVYGNLMPKVNPEKCNGCKLCEETCPDCAIKVEVK